MNTAERKGVHIGIPGNYKRTGRAGPVDTLLSAVYYGYK